MGAGIAKEFKRRYPHMFQEYRRLSLEDELELGDVYTYHAPDDTTIFNLVTQNSLHHASLAALERAVQKTYTLAVRHDITDLAMPFIGCGKGNLPKELFYETLKDFRNSSKHHVTVYGPITQPGAPEPTRSSRR